MDDRLWLSIAVDLARLCPPSQEAFSVGAVLVDADGAELARGFSREEDSRDHAEESALRKLAPGTEVSRATIYSSLEPCSKRASRPRSCTELILTAGIRRVVFAWREPPLFVDCEATALLRAAGVSVLELPELGDRAREPNAHLLLNS